MNTLVVIPARYASTRFPGKPLAMLCGKPVIQWVWERVAAIQAVDDVVVATDDERIREAVERFGGRAMMTADSHRSGTDRCGEVLRTLETRGGQYDIVVNVQGDEPFVEAGQLETLMAAFADSHVQIASLMTPIRTQEELLSPNNVKVVCGGQGNALYFSRQPLPYLRGVKTEQWLGKQTYYKHMGIYAFRAEVLKAVVTLPQSPLEASESLEQLRWLEAGYAIRMCHTEHANVGIDTPEDLAQAQKQLKNTIEN